MSEKSSVYIPFPAINADNILVLTQEGYLTGAEKALIFELPYFCEMESNAIVNPESGQYMTIA